MFFKFEVDPYFKLNVQYNIGPFIFLFSNSGWDLGSSNYSLIADVVLNGDSMIIELA